MMERNDLIERLASVYANCPADSHMLITHKEAREIAATIATLSEALAEAEKKALERAAEAVRILSYKQGTNSPAWIALRQAEDRIRNLSSPPSDLSQGGQP